MQEATLVFLVRENEILLGFKKRGFAQGKLNGFGGKIEDGETVAFAAARELLEECGVDVLPAELKSVARLDFFFPAKREWDQVVHVFIAPSWRGEPVETDEMKPLWFPQSAIPFDQMWADDQYWLPLVLKDQRVRAAFTFNGDNETIGEKEIYVDSIG